MYVATPPADEDLVLMSKMKKAGIVKGLKVFSLTCNLSPGTAILHFDCSTFLVADSSMRAARAQGRSQAHGNVAGFGNHQARLYCKRVNAS
jgi:hypothetical protein